MMRSHTQVDQALIERAHVDETVPHRVDGTRAVDQEDRRRIVDFEQGGEVAVRFWVGDIVKQERIARNSLCRDSRFSKTR